jgi:hypothetical protein
MEEGEGSLPVYSRGRLGSIEFLVPRESGRRRWKALALDLAASSITPVSVLLARKSSRGYTNDEPTMAESEQNDPSQLLDAKAAAGRACRAKILGNGTIDGMIDEAATGCPEKEGDRRSTPYLRCDQTESESNQAVAKSLCCNTAAANI